MTGAEVLVPNVVSPIVVGIYKQAIVVGLLTGFIGLIGIGFKKGDLTALILTDIVGLGMLVIVGAVATDLAESLVLPGLVVELAEILAISEILMSREMRKSGKKHVDLIPLPFDLDMEILVTAPNFIAVILIAYGAFLSGFTGGAVAGVGILFFVITRTVRGVPSHIWEGIAGISGMAWVIWLVGFIILFVTPYWLLGLFMAAFGILIKVASKVGLVGILGREEFKREK